MPWARNPSGAASVASHRSVSERSFTKTASVPSRARQAVSSARQPANCCGSSPDHHTQHVVYQAHAAAHPAHGAGQVHIVAAQMIGCGHQTRRPLGVRHDLFQPRKRSRQPRRQAVGQQAERLVTLPAVPARDQRPGRRPALIGAVARERTASVRVIRTRGERCRAPCFGANVLLAGEPRLVAKLHRPWPGGLSPRAGLFLLIGSSKDTGPAPLPGVPSTPLPAVRGPAAFARLPTRSVSGSF